MTRYFALPAAALSACLALFQPTPGLADDDYDFNSFDDRPLKEPSFRRWRMS